MTDNTKRKGWRKGPIRDGGMRLATHWINANLGVRVTFHVDGWYFCGDKVGNSLWNGRTFRTPIEAMLAAERAVAAAGGGA